MKNLLTKYLRSQSRFAQFLRFATVGVKVSIIDAGGVYLLPFLFGINLYSARILSLGAAILAGYLLNRYFTFGGDQRGCFYRQMAGHLGVHIVGGCLNYGVFSAAVSVGHNTLTNRLALSLLPLAAVWLGGLIGMTFNYFCSSRLVFKNQTL
jgi:putative flippase GtrA